MLLLEFYRRRRGLSQNELARRTGVQQAIISEHENGVRDPDKQLRTLATFLGVSPHIAHRLLEPLPASLDPLAVRKRIEAEFADVPEPEVSPKLRDARQREAAHAAHIAEANARLLKGRQ